MKLVAVLAAACGCVAAPVAAATHAAAQPPVCDAAQCVPYVAPNVSNGARCELRTRYPFGLDSSGGTLICAASGHWIPSRPLVGVRNLGQPCNGSTGAAQSPDGLPLACFGAGWTDNWTEIYYSSPV